MFYFVVVAVLSCCAPPAATGGSSSMQWRRFSAVNRHGKLADVTPIASQVVFLSITCLHMCFSEPKCSAVQYHLPSRRCELLNRSLCDGGADGGSLLHDSQWRYYDLNATKAAVSGDVFMNETKCVSEGKCSAQCARVEGEECAQNLQCQVMSDDLHCNATAQPDAVPRCRCRPGTWAYNSTHCKLQQVWSLPYATWVGKRIVGGVCQISLSLRMTNTFYILMGTNEDFSGSALRYYEIGLTKYYNSTHTSIYNTSQWLYGYLNFSIFNDTLLPYTLAFCNGTIRFGYEGEEPFVTLDDPNKFVFKFLAFLSYSQVINVDDYLYVPESLVDPYYPHTIETNTLRTNGNFWQSYDLSPNGSRLHNFTLHFRYMGSANADIGLYRGRDLQFQYQLRILPDELRLYPYLGGVYNVTSSDLVSSTEYRSFYITMNMGNFSFGRQGFPIPLMFYQNPNGYTEGFGFMRILSYNGYSYWQFPDLPHLAINGDGGATVPEA